MDYRGRKYYLVFIPYKYNGELYTIIKGTFPTSKIHYLPSENIPKWANKLMISCRYKDSGYIERLLKSIEEVIQDRDECYYPYGKLSRRRIRMTMNFRELTKDDLGQ